MMTEEVKLLFAEILVSVCITAVVWLIKEIADDLRELREIIYKESKRL